MQDINDILRTHFSSEVEMLEGEIEDVEEDMALLQILEDLMNRTHMNSLSAHRTINSRVLKLKGKRDALKVELEIQNKKLQEFGGYKED